MRRRDMHEHTKSEVNLSSLVPDQLSLVTLCSRSTARQRVGETRLAIRMAF